MIKKKRTNLFLFGCILLLLIIVGMIYFHVNPESSQLFPKCPFLLATGWKCPGCGSQRSIHALLHLDLRSAWGYNALLVLFLPYLILLLYDKIRIHLLGQSPLFFMSNHPLTPWLIAIMVILFLLLRNIFHF